MSTSVRPLQIRGIIIGLGVWLAMAVVASAVGITEKLVPPAPQVVVAVLTILLLALAGFHSALRTWVRSVDLRALVELHLIRAVAGAGFLLAASRGTFPRQFAEMAGKGDIAIALGALALILAVHPSRRLGLGLYALWNTLGLLDILHVVVDASRSAMSDPAAIAPLLKLPFAMLPFCIVPILIASHVWIFQRILARWRRPEPH